MLLSDVDVGHGALARDLLQGVLERGAIFYTRTLAWFIKEPLAHSEVIIDVGTSEAEQVTYLPDPTQAR